MANEAVVMMPEAPEGWQWVNCFGRPICERKYGPATARVEQLASGSWRSWACAYHPDATHNFISAGNQERSCGTMEIAITYAEEAGRLLQEWIEAPTMAERLRLCNLSRDGAMRDRERLRAAVENAAQGFTNLIEFHALPNREWEEAATALRDSLRDALLGPDENLPPPSG